MEAQKAVFLPTTHKVKELIKENVIGTVKYIEFKAGFPERFHYDHWMYDLSLGGGALYGSATYTIEYMQYLFENASIDIHGSCIPCPTGADDICNFQLIINNSLLVSSTIAMHVPLKNEAVFYGDDGYIVVPYYWKAQQLDVYLYNGEHQHYDFPYHSEFVYEINHIHQCLQHHLLESPVMNKEKSIQTVALVESLYQYWKANDLSK